MPHAIGHCARFGSAHRREGEICGLPYWTGDTCRVCLDEIDMASRPTDPPDTEDAGEPACEEQKA